ncbi:MAG: ATP-binding cassette domain-containing protein, partial [Clostridium sp.]|nr:ATP-binding cassette domain-containing protein [Clostridium sp.]
MLELKNIKKYYSAGDGQVEALKGINLQFRESEFVSILGPSGCGKTTMLNIIGGLDQYSSGDLVINGRSTKNFNDRDWDSYRNHSIGFVFQSYNLIPHQTVLQNVELALSLSGVSKAERKKRATEALEAVGLGKQLNKKPAEMSGGQMQRVAIARALVNNPDIILADEPTGALDTQTSIQVMDILKEVAKDRLVIMVTHNPELAEQYSTRIIKMLDGEIKDDSAPLSKQEYAEENKKAIAKNAQKQNEKMPTMSFRTSFGLSLKNLFSKKGRTVLTSFAGSIGIIGIALIYAVSQGMTAYINTLQEDTLSSYPLTLESQHMDVSTLLGSFASAAQSESGHEKDAVYQKGMIYDMMDSLNNMETNENDLAAFKTYIEAERADETSESGLSGTVSGIQYTYDMDMQVYTKNVDGTIIQSDSQALLQELLVEHFGMDLTSMMDMGDATGATTRMESVASMSPMGGGTVLWQEMLPGDNGKLISPLLEKQYDVIYGSWPTEYNEIVLVVDENNEIDDMALYALGLKSKDEINDMASAAINGTEFKSENQKWTYEEICDMDFRTVFSADCYTYDENTGLYTDLRDTQAGLKYLYDNGTDLKVSGIIRPNEESVSAMLTGTIAYTSELTEYIIENSKDSDAIKAQLEDKATDIFTGLPFKENTGNLTDAEKTGEFKNYIADLDDTGKANAYIKIMSIPSQEQLDAVVEQTMGSMTRADMEELMRQAISQQVGMAEEEIQEYISSMADEDIEELFTEMICEQIKVQYAAQVEANLGVMDSAQLAAILESEMENYTTEQFVTYYDEVLEFSDSSYDDNMRKLGYVDLEKPATINIYASSFENKDVIEAAIEKYNEGVDELEKITYTDYVGIMMSSVTTIINA